MTTTDPAVCLGGTPAFAQGIAGCSALLGENFGSALGKIFESLEWAEDEIEKVRARHRKHSDRLFHSFSLLTPTQQRMETEFVYRSHCRELLDRVAAGEDTRPGTAAEICCALLHVSQMSPMRSAAVGLYLRMWQVAGFPQWPELAEASANHEALEKSRIDDHERFARNQLKVTERRLTEITCAGKHHGEPVHCLYSRATAQLALDLD
ncbi:hypothetical protein AB0H76_09895 [Nocardia sp. NPDC050712]|uniref:hypothetical protein n=1 Tax=Nocardia sp. NPDC050712 TaxID=3155518 RepID=UPI0033D31FD8